MKYTTFENITRRLRGRLEITETNGSDPNLTSQLGYGSNIGGQEVDAELVEQIANQKELGFIDLVLGQIYHMPLRQRHFIIQEISECLICGEILRVHFQGTNLPQLGADVKGMAVDYFTQAYNQLASLTAGHNIYLPVQGPPIPARAQGTMQQHALVLPGEKLRVNRPDTITPSIAILGRRQKNMNGGFGIDNDCRKPGQYIDDGCRAFGQERWYNDNECGNPFSH